MVLSFRHKTVLGILLIEAVLLGALVWATLTILTSTGANELAKWVKTTGNLFAATSKDALLSSNLASLQLLVDEVLTNPDIIYARTLNRDGMILAQGGDKQVLARRFQADRNYTEVTDGVFDAFSSIRDGGITYGRVELGFSVTEINAAVATARRSGLLIAGALMFASALFALALGYYLTRAVNNLRQGAKMIAAGRLGYQIPVQGRDELAAAATAFNDMSAKLAELSSEQERTRVRLSSLADHDPLTGLMNRRRFHTELDKWIQHAVRYNHHVSLLFLDLDEFKYINDAFGHHVGDRFLVRVAALLTNEMRETDFISRLGGDEFGILLTETQPTNAELVAKRLLKHLAEANIEIEHHLLHTTGSIGIAACPDHSRNVENLLTRADIAMYRAKEKGRNRVHIFTAADEQLDQMRASIRWEERIKRALKENRFRLLYQRILPLLNHGSEIYEALLRMEDSDGKLIPPGEFLETAERFGLIEEIDKHVVRMACEKQVEMKAQGREIHLAINLSGYEFNNIAICDSIKAIITETGADPTRLIFEITETSALVNIYDAIKFMQGLTSIGCRFALDDFGSGFTSLSYLKIMPINIIKIDGVFVQNLDRNPRDQALVKSMAEMARAMDMKVTAEFVENEETLNLLKQMGVDHAQGYHIGRPGALH